MNKAFDLRQLVKNVCDNSAFTNDDDLTKEVLSRIQRGDERAALEQALSIVVQHFLSRDHRPLTFPYQSPPSGQPEIDTQIQVAAGGPLPFRSRKVHGIRAWADQLNARVAVGHKTRKFFGDCTRDDLTYLAAHRRQLAEANRRTAEYFEALNRLMGRLGVDTGRELPEDDVLALGGAA